MKKMVITLMLCLGILGGGMKKSEAGIIAITGNPVIGLGVGGGVAMTALMSLTMYASIAQYIELEGDTSGRIFSVVCILGAGTFLTLDAQDSLDSRKDFVTVPDYIFDEIKTMAVEKDGRSLGENIKEVIFTNTEVDDLFSSLDERVSDSELQQLRTILTTYNK